MAYLRNPELRSNIRDIVRPPGAAPTRGEAFGAFLRNYDARPRGGGGSGGDKPPGGGESQPDPVNPKPAGAERPGQRKARGGGRRREPVGAETASTDAAAPPEVEAETNPPPADTPEPGQRKGSRGRQSRQTGGEAPVKRGGAGSEPDVTTESAPVMTAGAAAAIQALRERQGARQVEEADQPQQTGPKVEATGGGSTSSTAVPPTETVAPPTGPTRRARPPGAGRARSEPPTTESGPSPTTGSTTEAVLAAEQQRRREEDRDRLVAEINHINTRIPTPDFNAFVAATLVERFNSLQDTTRVAPVTPEVQVAIREGITQRLRDNPLAQELMAEGVIRGFEAQALSLNNPTLRDRGREAISRTIESIQLLELDNQSNIPGLSALLGELGGALRYGGNIADVLTRGRANIRLAIEQAESAPATATPTEPDPAASAPHAEPAPGAHDAHGEAHSPPTGGKKGGWQRFTEWLDPPRPDGTAPRQPAPERKSLLDIAKEYMAGTYDSPLASPNSRPAASTQPATRPAAPATAEASTVNTPLPPSGNTEPAGSAVDASATPRSAEVAPAAATTPPETLEEGRQRLERERTLGIINENLDRIPAGDFGDAEASIIIQNAQILARSPGNLNPEAAEALQNRISEAVFSDEDRDVQPRLLRNLTESFNSGIDLLPSQPALAYQNIRETIDAARILGLDQDITGLDSMLGALTRATADGVDEATLYQVVMDGRNRMDVAMNHRRSLDVGLERLTARTFSQADVEDYLLARAKELAVGPALALREQAALQKKVGDTLDRSPSARRGMIRDEATEQMSTALDANDNDKVRSIIAALKVLGLDKADRIPGLTTETLEELQQSLQDTLEPADPSS